MPMRATGSSDSSTRHGDPPTGRLKQVFDWLADDAKGKPFALLAGAFVAGALLVRLARRR